MTLWRYHRHGADKVWDGGTVEEMLGWLALVADSGWRGRAEVYGPNGKATFPLQRKWKPAWLAHHLHQRARVVSL